MSSFLARVRQSELWTVLAPWLIATLCVLSLKCCILLTGGLHDSALSLRQPSLSVLQSLSLLRNDLLFSVLLVPAALAAIAGILPRRWGLAISTPVALLTQLLICVQFASYKSTGAFTSLAMMHTAFTWAAAHEDAVSFMPEGYVENTCNWTAAVVLVAALAVACLYRGWPWLRRLSLALFALFALLTAASLMPEAKTVWTPSLLAQSLQAAFTADASKLEMLSRSTPELLAMYQQNALVPAAYTSPLSGRARGYNVLFFIMESMSAHVVNPATDALADMPNLRRLRANSLVMQRHYTSYPLTNYALFSIYTSLYATCPPGAAIGDRPVEVPSVIRTLHAAGYQTGYYGFVWQDEAQQDDKLLKAVGFDKLVQPEFPADQIDDGATFFQGSVEITSDFDYKTLQLLRRDIRQWGQKKQRFVATYFPEISHDPYRSLDEDQPSTPLERGRALAARQDAWLGEIVHELESTGQLDHTIIVVTGDHGMRYLPFMPDSPDVWLPVERGKLEDVTMHVPMMIYLPRILRRQLTITEPTSHIDLAPTIEDLIGLRSRHELQEGISMLNTHLSHRRLFLLSDLYGASGYFEDGYYYMRTRSNLTYRSRELNFTDNDVLPFDSEESDKLRALLSRQDSVQRSLLSHILGQRVPMLQKLFVGI